MARNCQAHEAIAAIHAQAAREFIARHMHSGETLLQSKHFKDSFVKLTDKGLTMDVIVDSGEREFVLDGERFSRQRRLAKKLASMSPTRVVINPENWPLSELLNHFGKQQKDRGDTRFNLEYGHHENESGELHYDGSWSVGEDEGPDVGVPEGQTLSLVAFDESNNPVGFCTLVLKIWTDVDRPHTRDLTIDTKMVFVSPSERGKARGMDLSIAAGFVAKQVIYAMHIALRINKTIDVTVQGDYESEGGRAFVEQIHSDCEVALDMTAHWNQRMRKMGSGVTLDAGF